MAAALSLGILQKEHRGVPIRSEMNTTMVAKLVLLVPGACVCRCTGSIVGAAVDATGETRGCTELCDCCLVLSGRNRCHLLD